MKSFGKDIIYTWFATEGYTALNHLSGPLVNEEFFFIKKEITKKLLTMTNKTINHKYKPSPAMHLSVDNSQNRKYCTNCCKQSGWDRGYLQIYGYSDCFLYCFRCEAYLNFRLTEKGSLKEVKYFIKNGLPRTAEELYKFKTILDSANLECIKLLSKKFIPNLPIELMI